MFDLRRGTTLVGYLVGHRVEVVLDVGDRIALVLIVEIEEGADLAGVPFQIGLLVLYEYVVKLRPVVLGRIDESDRRIFEVLPVGIGVSVWKRMSGKASRGRRRCRERRTCTACSWPGPPNSRCGSGSGRWNFSFERLSTSIHEVPSLDPETLHDAGS